jgi:hypothetical protein
MIYYKKTLFGCGPKLTAVQTYVAAMIYYRKTLFGCGPKLTAVQQNYRLGLICK